MQEKFGVIFEEAPKEHIVEIFGKFLEQTGLTVSENLTPEMIAWRAQNELLSFHIPDNKLLVVTDLSK